MSKPTQIELKIEERGIDPKDPRRYVEIPADTFKEMVRQGPDKFTWIIYVPNACGGETRITIKGKK